MAAELQLLAELMMFEEVDRQIARDRRAGSVARAATGHVDPARLAARDDPNLYIDPVCFAGEVLRDVGARRAPYPHRDVVPPEPTASRLRRRVPATARRPQASPLSG